MICCTSWTETSASRNFDQPTILTFSSVHNICLKVLARASKNYPMNILIFIWMHYFLLQLHHTWTTRQNYWYEPTELLQIASLCYFTDNPPLPTISTLLPSLKATPKLKAISQTLLHWGCKTNLGISMETIGLNKHLGAYIAAIMILNLTPIIINHYHQHHIPFLTYSQKA